MGEAFLERWLEAVVATPGITSIASLEDARRMLLEDALRAAPLVAAAGGPVVDVGSGGGSPGIPLAVSLPELEFTLLETQQRKARFLERVAQGLPNVSAVWGRAEGQAVDTFAVALAKALAPPPVAAELCVPLVRTGGVALLWVGPTARLDAVASVAEQLGAFLESDEDGVLVLRKLERTPPGFPRKPGLARKRPLA